MRDSELVIGSFYWFNVLGIGLVSKSVMAKITAINNYGDVATYSAQLVDPVSGEISEIKAGNSWEFTKSLNKDEVTKTVEDIRTRLQQFITS